MSQVEEFQTFVNEVRLAVDEHHFAKAANALAGMLGYRWFAYIRIVQGCAELLSTYPSFWTDHYFASQFEMIDPVVAFSQSGRTAFTWGADEPPLPMSRERARLFDDAASFGIRFGVTVPLRGHSGQIAAFTLSTDEAPLECQRQADFLAGIQACGLRFHANATARLKRFMPKPSTHALTVRQHACLRSVADGHSAKETARLVKLTPRTVQYHLDAAKQRLHAENLPHAVALAMRRQIIS